MDTCYVIRTGAGTPLYATALDSWTADPNRALRFRFASIAEAYAINELGLSLDRYTVDLVPYLPPAETDAEVKNRVARAARRQP